MRVQYLLIETKIGVIHGNFMAMGSSPSVQHPYSGLYHSALKRASFHSQVALFMKNTFMIRNSPLVNAPSTASEKWRREGKVSVAWAATVPQAQHQPSSKRYR
jgi:hypothetical protein